MNKKSIIVICFIFCIISGCMSGKTPEFTKSPVECHEDILGKIAMSAGDDTIRGIAKITLNSSGAGYSRKTALLLKPPSSLYMETMPLFGPADFFLSANEKSLKVFFPGERKFYVGKATKETLFLFFRVFLSPGDMVSILTGLPPRILQGNVSTYLEEGLYRVDIQSWTRKQSLWVKPDDYTLQKIEKIDNGKLMYRVMFRGGIVIGGMRYPKRIEIEVEEPERANITIRYLDLEISHAENEPSFDLETPRGITPVFID